MQSPLSRSPSEKHPPSHLPLARLLARPASSEVSELTERQPSSAYSKRIRRDSRTRRPSHFPFLRRHVPTSLPVCLPARPPACLPAEDSQTG